MSNVQQVAPLTAAQVAQRMGVCVHTVWKWRRTDPRFPKGFKLGRLRRWNLHDIEAFLSNLAQEPTPQPNP